MKQLFLLIMPLFVIHFATAQTPYTFYYLAVGSADYEQDEENFVDPDFRPLSNVNAARISARLMGDLFQKQFHAKGDVILSTRQDFITRERVFSSLDKLDLQIQKDRPAKPFVIFYYCGHGTAENVAWSQILLLGHYTISGTRRLSAKENAEQFNDNIVILNGITEHFAEKKYEYMLLIDCCRQDIKKGEQLSKDVYSAMDQNFDTLIVKKLKAMGVSAEDILEAQKTFKDELKVTVGGLAAENEFEQSDPVVFATIPGKEADVVLFPTNSLVNLPGLDSQEYVGPLCRRSILAISGFYKSKAINYTVYDYINDLRKAQLDNLSQVGVSHYVDETEHAKKLVLIEK